MKTLKISQLKALLFGVLFAVLAGCGGSGGSGGGTDETVEDDENTSSTNGNWESLGTFSDATSLDTFPMVIGSDGNPVVAWIDGDNQVRVDRWDNVDGSWQQLGGTFEGIKPSIALNSNDQPLLVYWKAPDDTYFTAYAVQWNGTSWAELGGGDNAIVDRSTAFEDRRVFADVQFDSQGVPVIALPGVAAEKHNQIVVMRWESADWQAVGTSPQFDATLGVHTAALESDFGGRLVLAWTELQQDNNGFSGDGKFYAAEWGGTSWNQLGEDARIADEEVSTLEMDLESDGTPVIAWQSTAIWGTNGPTFLQRWNDSDSKWEAHGVAADDPLPDAWSPSLVLDSSNRPMIASNNLNTDREVSLRRWDSSIWRTVETELPGWKPAVALSDTGTIYLSVQHYLESGLSVYRLP